MDTQDTVELKLRVTPAAKRLLDTLSRHGLFGTTIEDVGERLLNERLRVVVQEGWLGVTGFSDGRTEPLVRPVQG